MADSPSHRFGQVIGNILEEILLPVLLRFCEERGLYLDRHGDRIQVRRGKKVSWEDRYGNTHDLDFVIEKDGSATKRGKPVAFIEAAWRRYTKHSKNKVQEIQGAVLPVAEKYERDQPFLGAVLAGEFTKPSLDQLRSIGFKVVYLPYETIVSAFSSVRIDARFDESTPDAKFAQCIQEIEQLSGKLRTALKDTLFSLNKSAFEEFFTSVRVKLDRIIERVLVLPLFGNSISFDTVEEASNFIAKFDSDYAAGEFQKYELIVMYSNKDEIRGIFTSKERAKDFLRYVAG